MSCMNDHLLNIEEEILRFAVNILLIYNLMFHRIAAVCGDFYIGGRQFFSLSDLVAYYTSNDLLKRERLADPIPPPEPVNDK